MIGNKNCNYMTLYRSPSQKQDDFQAFRDNLKMNVETLAQRNSFLMVVIGDFNIRSKHRCSQDSTNFEGVTIEIVTSQFDLSQINKEATHILDSSSLCIDPIFTTQPNLVVESGVHPSLHPIVAIKLYSQNLIYKYITHHHICEKSDNINKQILNLSDEHLLTLIGIKPVSILMLTRKFLSSATLY